MTATEKVVIEGSRPATTTRPRRTSAPRGQRLWQLFGPPAIFVALFAVVAALTPGFLGGGALSILAVQATPILLVALGQSAVLHIGSIDLSNAAIGLLSAVVLAITLAPLAAAAPLLCIVVATLVGLVNGVVFAFTQVPSFALTLGTLGVLQAATLILSNATTVYVTANAALVSWLFENGIVGIPIAFWLSVILAVAFWAFLRFTVAGQGLTAVGRNEIGAVFSGLRTRMLKATGFAISGFFAGIAGVMIVAQAGAVSSFGLGSDLLLPGIAAAIVGGTAITGGATNPINIVFGALTVALIPIGAAAVGINAQAQSLVYGVVIIVVVALTLTRARGRIVK